MIHDITDMDLPPSRRTMANLYQAEYFRMLQEVQKANKGIRRLRKKNEALRKRLEDKP